MNTKDDDVTKARKERRRLYAIEYRRQNSEKLKERHEERMLNDAAYARRYREKQERRKHRYQESHAAAVEFRKERRIQLAMAREERERERQRKQKAKRYSEKNEECRAKANLYRKKNQDKINENRRFLWHNDLKFRSSVFYSRIKSAYGLTQQEYIDLYIKHNGRCSICNVSESEAIGRGNGLHVDHCHTTKSVRGLLCHKCNTALGGFKDSIEILNSAIAYLMKY